MSTLTESNRVIFKKWCMELKEPRLKIVRSMISKHRGKLLDLACSKGEFSSCFLSEGIGVYGLDLEMDKLREAKEKGVKVVMADASHKLPFKNEKFDIVFAGEILEHVVDTDQFISEAARVLRKGGSFILTTPNLISMENRMRVLFGKYPIWLDYRLGISGHVRGYTPKVLKEQLKMWGFKVLSHTGNWVPFIPQRYIDDVKLPALAVTGRLFPNLAMDIIIEAEKI